MGEEGQLGGQDRAEPAAPDGEAPAEPAPSGSSGGPETGVVPPPREDAATTTLPAAVPSPPDELSAVPGKPRRKRRRWIMALSIILGVIVVLVIAAFVTAHYTSASSFCNSCHEMNPYHESWQTSSHSSVECRQCHIPPGTVPYIETKLGSFREVWVHVTGKPEAPLAVTREIPDSNCLACHNPPPDPSLPTVTFSHEKHAGIDCISCHVRLVHTTVNPPFYQDPAAMSSCLQCHTGSIAPNNCSYCHTAPHEARGECSDCHNQQSWTSSSFNHPFPLTGGHANLACTDCHGSRPGVETIPGTDLAKADPACVSCHGDHHTGLTDCAACHTPDGWQNTSFVHPQVGEHIPNGEKPLKCTDCHRSGYGSATCTLCHAETPDGE